ncbi:ABC transporter substrate-binding protein [Paenibacillus sp. PL2-23]|uniref:ABC transporter substrate-binding protein n=1 Tax=Paenibacillus sp. PL2-23 TaxID=2100729 RepID=UPI0030F8C329
MRLTYRRTIITLLLFVIFSIAVSCSAQNEKQSQSDNGASGTTDDALLSGSWEQVLSAARGGTVNWYMWGGSEAINTFVDQKYGSVLKEQYGITLRRVPVSDTAEAVTKVLNEKQAGKHSNGSVDLIWINGENFATLKQGDALFGPFADKLPHSAYVDYSNPVVGRDFGLDTNGYESVWGSAQFQLVYDADRLQESELPRSYAELKDWIKQHPGRFTYNAPPDFIGTRFVKQLFYELTGGYEGWEQPFDQAVFETESSKVWDYLNEIKPYLWRNGDTYPKSIAELNRLFNNNEIDFTFTQEIGGIASDINRGILPETAAPYVFDTGTIGDYHYVAIPYNAANKAAAMVVANLILEPGLQFQKASAASGWGDGLGIDPARLTGDLKKQYDEISEEQGQTAVPADVLLKFKLPDLAAAYTPALEEGWKTHVLFQK